MSLNQIQTLLISLLIPFAIFAQDYQSFRSDRRYNYGYFFHVGFNSVTMNGKDSIITTFDNVWYDYITNCYNTIGGSFIGTHAIIKADGYDVFLNKDEDSIYIKRDARLNESWLMHRGDTALFVATVINHDTLSFLGVTDSVKTIQLAVYDTAMNPIWHNVFLNPDTFELSKNFGLIKSPGFRVFPLFGQYFDPDAFAPLYPTVSAYARHLQGMSNPILGIQDLRALDVYDFQVGDELHVEEYSFSSYGADYYHSTKKIQYSYLERFDHSPTFVEYIVLVRKRTVVSDWNQVKNDTYYEKNESQKYYAAGQLDQPSNTSIYGRIYKLSIDGLSKTKSLYYESPSGFGACTTIPCCHGCDRADEYRKGLGGPYYECSDFAYGEVRQHRILKYFKKADTTWGTPFTDVGFEEYSTKDLKLFPNPSNNQLYISLTNKKALENAQIEIYDLSGRLLQIQEGENTSHNSTYLIDVSELSPGSYLLRVITSAESLVGRFEVRDDLE